MLIQLFIYYRRMIVQLFTGGPGANYSLIHLKYFDRKHLFVHRHVTKDIVIHHPNESNAKSSERSVSDSETHQ